MKEEKVDCLHIYQEETLAMEDTPNILRLRVLLAFYQEEGSTVTGIARMLGEEHYTVSRIVTALEKEGLISRPAPRSLELTELGKKEAERLSKRVSVSQNHLMYEGVSIEEAKNDALHWALYCSDATMRVISEMEEIYRIKYELRGESVFSGALLAKKLGNGTFAFPFVVYREQVKNGDNISMANEGFEHPCHLVVENGVGTIQLKACTTKQKSASNGRLMSGKVNSVQYFDSGEFLPAEHTGDVFTFPVSLMKFRSMGTGTGQVLHGSLCLRMKCSVGIIHMPEATAIFTILI